MNEDLSVQEWKLVYEQCKEPGWPDYVENLSGGSPFKEYPREVCEKVIDAFYRLKTRKIYTTGSIDVFYENALNGGGIKQSSYYLDIIKSRYKNRVFKKCYEWCSGPGFIGFSLLGHGLCKSVCFSDIHGPAIDCVKDSINHNNCKGTAYLGKDLSCLPSNEIFDLVVANPPHFKLPADFHATNENDIRINVDLDWQAHKDFFRNIKKNLASNGIVLLQENTNGSALDVFLPFISQSGLRVTDVFYNRDYSTDNSSLYYIELTHENLHIN